MSFVLDGDRSHIDAVKVSLVDERKPRTRVYRLRISVPSDLESDNNHDERDLSCYSFDNVNGLSNRKGNDRRTNLSRSRNYRNFSSLDAISGRNYEFKFETVLAQLDTSVESNFGSRVISNLLKGFT